MSSSLGVKQLGTPLALEQNVYHKRKKKGKKSNAKPSENYNDLAHTVDKRFVTTFLLKIHPYLISQKGIPTTDELLTK